MEPAHQIAWSAGFLWCFPRQTDVPRVCHRSAVGERQNKTVNWGCKGILGDSGNKTIKKEMIFVMMLLHFALFCLVNLLCFVFFLLLLFLIFIGLLSYVARHDSKHLLIHVIPKDNILNHFTHISLHTWACNLPGPYPTIILLSWLEHRNKISRSQVSTLKIIRMKNN